MIVVLQMCICAHFKQYSHLSKDPLAWVAREHTKWKHLSVDMAYRVLMWEGMSMYKIFSPALFFYKFGLYLNMELALKRHFEAGCNDVPPRLARKQST